ncbi:uncharacterized protein FIBRA_06751 [Fibroporia radiculosa]|uniref:Small ribosomal subunit protein mS33 n=1 Tax=Fibroporia radiculosa TaxID=599839 RepID=J4GTF1_9APHY|nr:uncharacterized protein FIBRA_06751 [Fibroporia radiculosa]CCM04570.1 predicted protein [Fibroporia radiculosa]
MAAVTQVLPSRIAALTRLRCAIFQTSYNPTSVRTGAKYLRARLRGPSMVEYYPEEVTVAKFNRMFHGEWKIMNPDEENRLADIEAKKRRGKGAPKKAKSAESEDTQETVDSTYSSPLSIMPIDGATLCASSDMVVLFFVESTTWTVNLTECLVLSEVHYWHLLSQPSPLVTSATLPYLPLFALTDVTFRYRKSACSVCFRFSPAITNGVMDNDTGLVNFPAEMSVFMEKNNEAQNGFLSEDTVSEASMALQLERMRVEEALCARDVAVQHLSEACLSVRHKDSIVEALRQEKDDLEKQVGLLKCRHSTDSPGIKVAETRRKMTTEVRRLAELFRNMRTENTMAKQYQGEESEEGEAYSEDEEILHKDITQEWETTMHRLLLLISESSTLAIFRDVSSETPRLLSPIPTTPGFMLSPVGSPNIMGAELCLQNLALEDSGARQDGAGENSDTTDCIRIRNATLAALPLPSDVPPDVLRPIVIPSPYTLHEFLGTAPITIRAQLGNYRVFQQSTTAWCPEREEHGYFLTPAFKCHTNPRVSTAHRWVVVNMSSKLNRPIECFYNKDGKWYYAGIYKAFWLDELTSREWDNLSTEATQSLIKETLAGRKNISPQNVYETSQLYAAGALKVTCIGLQCVGFNDALYGALLDHASTCAQTGKWRCTSAGGGPFSPGSTWVSPMVHLSPNAGSAVLTVGKD